MTIFNDTQPHANVFSDKYQSQGILPAQTGSLVHQQPTCTAVSGVGPPTAPTAVWSVAERGTVLWVAGLDDVMESIVLEVDGALGCAVADMRSGALLGVAHHVPYFTQEYLEAVAAAAVEMFRGRTVRHVEDMISAKRGRPSERLIEEMQMTTRHTIHFMMVLPNHPEAVVVLITRRATSLGMGWSATRRSVLKIEPILDGVSD